MTKKIRNLLFLIASAIALMIVFVLLTMPRPATFATLPSQNGYDDFLNASRLIKGDIYQATTNQDRTALRDLLAANTEPLRLIHLGLTRPCALPTEAWVTNLNAMFDQLSGQKHIGLLLDAEGKFAEQEGRAGDAAGIYLDDILYGSESSRGGLIINRLVGIACESIGCDALVKLSPKLNCEQSRPIIAGLEKIDRTGVTWNEVMQGENAFAAHELRKSFNPVMWVMGKYLAGASRKKAEIKNQVISARLRLLAAELALRCYQSGEGKVAERLEQLVPKYLEAVPEDPFSRAPLVYHASDSGWELSSVGLPGTNGTRGLIKLNVPSD